LRTVDAACPPIPRLVELIEVFPERPVPSFELPDGLPAVKTHDDVEAVADALRRA